MMWYLVFVMIWTHPVIDTSLWFKEQAECEKAATEIYDGVRKAFDLHKDTPFVKCIYKSR